MYPTDLVVGLQLRLAKHIEDTFANNGDWLPSQIVDMGYRPATVGNIESGGLQIATTGDSELVAASVNYLGQIAILPQRYLFHVPVIFQLDDKGLFVTIHNGGSLNRLDITAYAETMLAAALQHQDLADRIYASVWVSPHALATFLFDLGWRLTHWEPLDARQTVLSVVNGRQWVHVGMWLKARQFEVLEPMGLCHCEFSLLAMFELDTLTAQERLATM